MSVKKTKEKREGSGILLDVTVSGSGKMLIQNVTGAEYWDAVDPPAAGRTYTEGRARPAI